MNKDGDNDSARTVFLRVLTTTTETERVARLRSELEKRFRGAELRFSELEPYWKIEGWGEMNVTVDTARLLNEIQNQLACKWESDTASAEFLLPDVGFLWVGE